MEDLVEPVLKGEIVNIEHYKDLNFVIDKLLHLKLAGMPYEPDMLYNKVLKMFKAADSREGRFGVHTFNEKVMTSLI